MAYDIIMDGNRVGKYDTLPEVGDYFKDFFAYAEKLEHEGVFNLDDVTFRILKFNNEKEG